MVETPSLNFNSGKTLNGWVYLAKLVNLSLIYFQGLKCYSSHCDIVRVKLANKDLRGDQKNPKRW